MADKKEKGKVKSYEYAIPMPERPEVEETESVDSRQNEILVAPPTPEGEEERGIPMDFRNIDPTDRGLVNRATAKYGGIIDDRRTDWEKMGGVGGSVLGFADDFIMPDDVGGILRGDSDQWVPDVPYLTDAYQNTGGAFLGANMDVVSSIFGGLEWFTNNVAAGVSWGGSVLPGGPRTMDLEWDGGLNNVGDGADVSAAGMATSVYSSIATAFEDDAADGSLLGIVGNSLANAGLMALGGPVGQAVSLAAIGSRPGGPIDRDENVYFLSKDFDVYDEEDSKIAFEEQTIGKLITGVQDAAAVVAFDPLTYASFPIKMVTSGIKGSKKFPGMTNKSLEFPEQRIQLDKDIDAGLLGEKNAAIDAVDELYYSTEAELLNAGSNNPFLKNMVDSSDLLAIKTTWGVGEEGRVTAAATIKALNGSDEALQSLMNAEKWDTVKLISEKLNNNIDLFVLKPDPIAPMNAMQLEVGRGIVRNAMRVDNKNPALRGGIDGGVPFDSPMAPRAADAKDFVVFKPENYVQQGSVLPQFSNRGPTSMRLSRMGLTNRAAKAQVASRPTRKQKQDIILKEKKEALRVAAGTSDEALDVATSKSPLGVADDLLKNETTPRGPSIVDEYNGQWFYRTIKATSSSTPVRIVRWMGRGLPPGIIHLKGGDAYRSNDELRNWLRLTYLNPERQSEIISNFIAAGNPTAKASVIMDMEREAVEAVARRADIDDPKMALEIYESYNASRKASVKNIRSTYDEVVNNGEEAFAPGLEAGDPLITTPGLFSELDEAFPLLDIKEFRAIVKSNKIVLQQYSKGKLAGRQIADVLNNGWKVSVLLRLGYTARNLVEGAGRSAAVMGTIALNPAVLGRVPSSLKYAAYKQYYKSEKLSGSKSFPARARALDDAISQMKESSVFARRAEVESLEEEILFIENEIEMHENLLRVSTERDSYDQVDLLQENFQFGGEELKEFIPVIRPRPNVNEIKIGQTASEIEIIRLETSLAESRASLKSAQEKIKNLSPDNPKAQDREVFGDLDSEQMDDEFLSSWRERVRSNGPLFESFKKDFFGGQSEEDIAKSIKPNRLWFDDPDITTPNGFDITVPPGLSIQGRKDFINYGVVSKTFVLKMINSVGLEETLAWLRNGSVESLWDDVFGSGTKSFGIAAPLRINPKTGEPYKEAKQALPEEFTQDFEVAGGLIEPPWTLGGAYGRQQIEIDKALGQFYDMNFTRFSDDFDSGNFDQQLINFILENPSKEYSAALKKFNDSAVARKLRQEIKDSEKKIRSNEKSIETQANKTTEQRNAAYLKEVKARRKVFEDETKLAEGVDQDYLTYYKKFIEKLRKEAEARRVLIKKNQEGTAIAKNKDLARLENLRGGFAEKTSELADLERQTVIVHKDVERMRLMLQETLDKVQSKKPKWNRIGEGGNRVGTDSEGNPIIFPSAFDGSEGSMARLLSAADKTYQEVFKTGFDANLRRMKARAKYIEIDPSNIAEGDKRGWAQYWNNLTDRLNRRNRQDEIIYGWLRYGDEEGDMLEATRRMLLGDSRQSFRAAFVRGEGKRPLNNKETGKADPEAVDEFIDEMYRRYTMEIPKGTGMRETLLKQEMTVFEVRAAMLKNRSLPRISALAEDPVRLNQGKVSSFIDRKSVKDDSGNIKFFQTGTKAVGWSTGLAMKILGSIPETKLLRHPFYAAAFHDEQLRMVRLAIQDGRDPTTLNIQNKINKTAHVAALKETRKIMYTIEEQTNISNLLRFLFPFFPAWENTLKTWGRIVADNPAVLVFANELWNIPNSLGWVVDENGNKVDWSNFLDASENNKIMYPDNYKKANEALHGIPVLGSAISNLPIINAFMPPVDEDGKTMPTGTRQSSINVVVQGGLFDPGIGALVPMTSKAILQGKPELTEIFRNSVPEEFFRRVVPNGDPNTKWRDIIAPTVVKKQLDYAFGGENENTAYLRLKDTMVQDAIIKAASVGRQLSQKDFEKVIRNADKMWEWTISQAFTGFTASTGYSSDYAVERQIWRDLLDNTSLSYRQKIVKFIKKIEIANPGSRGEDFLALTQSTTESKFKVNPNKQAYDRLVRDKKIVDDIAEKQGKEFVGMYTNIGDWAQVFDRSVYSEQQQMEIDGYSVKQKKSGFEIYESNQVSSGWREYFLIIDEFNEQAIAAGYGSYKEIEGSSEFLTEQKKLIGAKYPAFREDVRSGFETNRTNKAILTAEKIVENATEEDRKKIPAINTIERFLNFRKFVVESLAEVDDDKTRKQIVEIANAEVSEIRSSGDPGFVDFYDKWFSEDDFRKAGQDL